MTIRENIKELLASIWNSPDMQPMEASDKLIKLSAMLGNIGDAIVGFEQAYAQIKIDKMLEDSKLPISKIEILCQVTDEYRQLREAKELQRATIEAVRSLKVFIKVRENEYGSM